MEFMAEFSKIARKRGKVNLTVDYKWFQRNYRICSLTAAIEWVNKKRKICVSVSEIIASPFQIEFLLT